MALQGAAKAMAAAFQAFAVESVLDTFQKKIEALECVQEGLLAGLTDGTLVLLRPDAREATAPWQVSQAYRSLCKKGSTQLQVQPRQSLAYALQGHLFALVRTLRLRHGSFGTQVKLIA